MTVSTATAFGPAPVLVHPDVAEMARAAAEQAATVLRTAVRARGVAHECSPRETRNWLS